MISKKKLLGAHSTFTGQQRVYEMNDSLLVDDHRPTEVQRYRVFFDDVQAVTFHHYKGMAFLATTGILGILSTIVAVGIMILEPVAGAIFFFLFGLPFIVLFLLRVTLGVDSVTIYGRRTRARVSFWFGKQRAWDAYRQVAERIRRHQEKAAPRPPPPPAADPFPAPPPLPPQPPPPEPPAPGS